MKYFLTLVLVFSFIGCSSSKKKESLDKQAESNAESTKNAMEDVSETTDAVVGESVATGSDCPVSLNYQTLDFGERKVTSRAFRRLKLNSSTPFKITDVSSFEKPFGFYNTGEFPGAATYKDYKLCDMSEVASSCSLNIEFRPTAIAEYSSRLMVSYIDEKGNDCSVKVLLKGVSTESYLGDDTSR